MSTWIEGCRWQAQACADLGSAFSARLLNAMADGELGPLDDLFAAWDGQKIGTHIREATPLRLLGALHCLVLTGQVPELAAHYPASQPDTDTPALLAAARAVLQSHRPAIAAFMASPPQTNEVGRSFCLAPGFLRIVAETGLPLSILEIGASAGLNLRWDQYAYDFGGAAWGDPAAPVRLEGGWEGARPAVGPAQVVARAACDQSPIDVADDEAALRLEAYVWADQPARMARLRGAIAVARATPASLVKADAVAWVAANLHPSEGVATVLFHSVMWQYMPRETQKAVSEAIDAAARRTTSAAPLAWLRMEPDSTREGFPMAVRLTIWPDGREIHLADVHPHGAWVRWLAG